MEVELSHEMNWIVLLHIRLPACVKTLHSAVILLIFNFNLRLTWFEQGIYFTDTYDREEVNS